MKIISISFLILNNESLKCSEQMESLKNTGKKKKRQNNHYIAKKMG